MSANSLKIPRPPNKFIFYRSYASQTLRIICHGNTVPGCIISKIAGFAWQLESEETRMEFHRMAYAAKKAHQLQYPGWQYKPNRKATQAAAGSQRTKKRNANAMKAIQKARKDRKTTVVCGVNPPTPSSTPPLSPTSSYSEPSSLFPTPLPTPPPTMPLAPIGLGGFPYASQGLRKQPWMNAAESSLNQLSPEERLELLRRIQLLYGMASSMGPPQQFSSYPMGHGPYGATQHGLPPNYHYEARNGFVAPQRFTSPHDAWPSMDIHQPDMSAFGLSDIQQADWHQPPNVNFDSSHFAAPVPHREPSYFPEAGGSASAAGGDPSWAIPWSSTNDFNTEDAIEIPDSPMQAPMSMPDPLDMSTVLSAVPSDETHEPESSMPSAAPTNPDLPVLSDTEVVEMLQSVFEPSGPSSVPSPSLLDDGEIEDPLRSLSPDYLWPQELDEWMDVDRAAT